MHNTQTTKAEQLYAQCLEAYEECRTSPAALYNNMPSPGMFNDSYNVPAELLFEEICRKDKRWRDERHGFYWRLLAWAYERKEWDFESFSKIEKRPLKFSQYVVYLELFYRCATPKRRPFTAPIIIDKARIEWCSKREYRAKYEEYRIREQERRDKSKSTYLEGVPDYKDARNFPGRNQLSEACLHPMKITVDSTDNFAAVLTAIEKLDLVLNCLNVAQGLKRFSMRLNGGNENNLSTKTVFIVTGYYIVCGLDTIDTYSSDSRTINSPSGEYKPSKIRRQLFWRILKIATSDSIVCDRIRCVLRDLALAYGSAHAGAKTISYWRCLEHATRSRNKNRPEKEIIKIFQYRFSNKYWRQMGQLVLSARNRYVHSGLHSGGEEYIDQYVNWAQRYAEQALYLLLWLYDKRKYWGSEEELDAFFDICVESQEFLQVASRIHSIRKGQSRQGIKNQSG